MFRIWRSMTPFASDNVAAASVFANTRGLAIFHDMNGSMACAERFMGLANTPCFYCATLGKIRRDDYLNPDPERFLDQYLEIIDECNPDFVVLLYGPVSSQVGLDLEMLATVLRERRAIPVIAIPTPMDRDYSYGISRAFEAIHDALKPELISMRRASESGSSGKDTVPERLALIGVDALDYAGLVNCRTMLPFYLCAWGCSPTLEDHALVSLADKMVVMSFGALGIARRMSEELSIPYVLLEDCDLVRRGVPHLRDMRCRMADMLDDMFEASSPGPPWMQGERREETLRMLIVGDQVIAHAAAKTIEELISERQDSFANDVICDFDFALPCGYDDEIAGDSDFAIEDEDELISALTCPEYDIVVGPSGLSRFAQWSRYVILENLAMRGQ